MLDDQQLEQVNKETEKIIDFWNKVNAILQQFADELSESILEANKVFVDAMGPEYVVMMQKHLNSKNYLPIIPESENADIGVAKHGEDSVTITKQHYKELIKQEQWLQALQEAGVDNWQGIEFAYDILNGENTF